ncbi:uncharacterized protein LOC134859728 isoform X2 [Eleginops maclovinus]|uniref:uncharacterized protein LOC134859728 isoform X2 n=1 Tax=Eleginops maclovinus TaxID=56733 RepID=UPI0030809A12
MVVRGVSLYLLLGYLIKTGSTCFPVHCKLCFTKLCFNASAIPSNCTKDFQVSVNSNNSKLKEGEDIHLRCVHKLPDQIPKFGWMRDKHEIQHQNESELHVKKVLSNKAGKYICFVRSVCGYYESAPHDVTVENNSVVMLVVCGVSALVLVLVMGLAMKFKLKRDNANHRERMKQKATMEQRAAQAPFPPRES